MVRRQSGLLEPPFEVVRGVCPCERPARQLTNLSDSRRKEGISALSLSRSLSGTGPAASQSLWCTGSSFSLPSFSLIKTEQEPFTASVIVFDS